MSLLSSHKINRYVLYRAKGTVTNVKCCSIQLRPLLWACPPLNFIWKWRGVAEAVAMCVCVCVCVCNSDSHMAAKRFVRLTV